MIFDYHNYRDNKKAIFIACSISELTRVGSYNDVCIEQNFQVFY